MAEMNNRFKVNNDQIVAKVMDGEAILINLTNGMYYSMDGVAGFVWTLINSGHTLTETCERISSHYGVSDSQVETDVKRLICELVEENLVLITNDATPSDIGESPPQSAGGTYQSPQLMKYSDMADIFAIDPPMPKIQDEH